MQWQFAQSADILHAINRGKTLQSYLIRNLADAAMEKANFVSQKIDNDADNAMLTGHLTIMEPPSGEAGTISLAHRVNV